MINLKIALLVMLLRFEPWKLALTLVLVHDLKIDFYSHRIHHVPVKFYVGLFYDYPHPDSAHTPHPIPNFLTYHVGTENIYVKLKICT